MTAKPAWRAASIAAMRVALSRALVETEAPRAEPFERDAIGADDVRVE